MDFTLTEAQQTLQHETREFARSAVGPKTAEREALGAIDDGTIAKLAERGLLGVNLPRAYGGLGAGVVAYALAIREISEADGSVAVTMAVTNMVGELINALGTDAQKEEHLPKLTSGDYFGGAFALTEPGCGSDAAALTTRAERSGDHWVIRGEKLWITTGDRAGVVVTWARTGGPGPKGISCFLVDGNASGLESGAPEHKMGIRSSHTVGLSFQGVRVPASAMLGKEGEGFKIAMMALDGGRIGISSQAIGYGFRALELARAHCAAQKSVSQSTQFKLADIATEIDAAWLMALRAAWLKERGERFSHEAAMAKLFAAESANPAVGSALEILAEAGAAESSSIARIFRDCRVTEIYEGTSEIQRLVISREILRVAKAQS